MRHIALIITLLTLLACTNAGNNQQSTVNSQQSMVNGQQSTDNSQQTTDNCQQSTDKDSTLLPAPYPLHPAPCSLLPKSLLLGKFDPSTDSNFVAIPSHMTTHTNIYCHRQTLQAYIAMRDSALCDGITLTIVSATRNFDRQRQIWERKWQNTQGNDSNKIRQIMRYSSMPGTSRHHWGTDLDFISVETDYWTHGEGLRIYQWLCANAHKFGFFQPYTSDPTRTGYAEERWHWSYAPLSKPYLEAYQQQITPSDITGFSGSYLVDSLKIIQSHVLGISQ
ncbi:MAG: M15 family metallopeptidase [Paludibacteraceae bacterium]|nr:M15 family metallopeptidase [Paludibacteraceae bacterium]